MATETQVQTQTQIPSTIHGEIGDKANALWAAVTTGLPDYLFTESVISLLWKKGFIEVGRSYNTDEGRHFIYQATKEGRAAFSSNNYLSEE